MEEKMKKISTKSIALTVILLMIMTLSGCADETPEITTFEISFENNTNYDFHNIFISPTASDVWGHDILGSTNILKNNSSFNITLDISESDIFDIRIIDNEQDEYIFLRVPLNEGTELSVYFDDGIKLSISGASRTETIISGELNITNADTEDEDDEDIYEEDDSIIEVTPVPDEIEPRSFDFTIYNESAYEITQIFIFFDADEGVGDNLVSGVLSPDGGSIQVTGAIDDSRAEIDWWFLIVIDVDGDGNANANDIFDPWNLNYLNIRWDSGLDGYIFEFVYH